MPMRPKLFVRMTLQSIAILGMVYMGGCQKEAPPEECVDSGKAPMVIEKTPLRLKQKKSDDFCQACVMAKAGFASCQRVWKLKGEERAALKTRAKKKACEDAGYTLETCPEKALISNICKGDPPPPGTTSAGKALQNFTVKSKKFIPRQEPTPSSKSSPGDAASTGDTKPAGPVIE